MATYDEEFYRKLQDGARSSARAIVPIVMDMLAPRSVIDLGCGVGTWLGVFREDGVEDVTGVDGHYVKADMLEIPRDRFVAADLKEPFAIGRRFDLACSMEVAEHLPPERSEEFVDTLVKLAPAVLFSAAIPHQGGAEHINERWQDEWAAMFQKRGYMPVDCIRRRVWSDARVEYWYAQNMLLYVRPEVAQAHPKIQREYEAVGAAQLAIVHPKRYLEWVQWGFEQCGRANAARGG